mgnify:CR=1 FL=1
MPYKQNESKRHINKCSDTRIVIPPPNNAVAGNSDHEQRNNHTDVIKIHGRMAW